MTTSDDKRLQPVRRNPLAPAAPLLKFGLSLPPELRAPRVRRNPLAVAIAAGAVVAVLLLLYWMNTGQTP